MSYFKYYCVYGAACQLNFFRSVISMNIFMFFKIHLDKPVPQNIINVSLMISVKQQVTDN